MSDSPKDPEIAFGDPAIYRIRVRGPLNERTAEYIGDVQIEERDARGATLKVSVKDQAGLSGVLEALYGLNLTILSVAIQRNQKVAQS